MSLLPWQGEKVADRPDEGPHCEEFCSGTAQVVR